MQVQSEYKKGGFYRLFFLTNTAFHGMILTVIL